MKPMDASYFDRDCCKPFFNEGGPDGLLLLHGFTGSVAHMRKLGDAMTERGYTVMGINLPGHATTESDMARTGWQDWLQASKQAVLTLRERCERLTVCGLSMGGVLALLLAEQMKIDACAPISAPMATQNKLMPFAKLIAPVYPRVSWSGGGDSRSVLDAAYDCGYSGFPTRKAADLNYLIHLARRNLFSVACPVLAVQSADDETIWAGSADCILEGVSSELKRKLWLHGVPHVCTISPELPAIVDALDDLMKTVAKSAGEDAK